MKAGRFFLLWTILGLGIVLHASFCNADPKKVKACGTGTTRSAAIEDAQRNAVEQGLGAVLDSQTIIKNDQMVRNIIYSQSSGYVKTYTVISEGRKNVGNAHEVCVKATVQLASIKDDYRALANLIKRYGNPRFMTVYVPGRRASLPGNCGIVSAVEQTVNNAFIRKGFLLLDKTLVRDVQNEILRSGRASPNVPDLSGMALKKAADLLLVLDVGSVERTDIRNKYFAEASIDVSLKVVAPATSEIIASASDYKNVRTVRTAIDHVNENPMTEKKARQMAKRVAESVLEETVAHIGRQFLNGTRYACLFTNFNQNEIFTIIGIIENLGGFKGKDVRNDNFKAFEMDIRYLGKKFEFQRELHETLREKGIDFQFQEAGGNSLHLVKKGR